MSARSQLEKKIDNKKQEIMELESELREANAKLREANAFLLGLQEALRFLPKEEKDSDERAPEQILRAGSSMAKARDYLRAVGKPMYISEILKNIGLEVNKNNRVSVSGSLGSYARKGLVFTHTGPNVFGLIEFGEVSSTEDVSEPPEGFGIESMEEEENGSLSA